MAEERPQIGIGVFLINDNDEILLGKRKGSHGEGEYALPGGHLEMDETFEECALRELAEEAGPDIRIKGIDFLCLTNMRRYAPKHYADIGMVAKWESGESRVMEPHKKEEWRWYSLDNLPRPLFGCTDNYIEAYRTGKKYFLA
jgi:8-oxo-dGTP diphosphatase